MRRSKAASSKTSRLRAIPWAAMLRVGVVVTKRWTALSAKERARIASLVSRSRGRPGNLNRKERDELLALLGKLDLLGIGRELRGLAAPGRRRKHR